MEDRLVNGTGGRGTSRKPQAVVGGRVAGKGQVRDTQGICERFLPWKKRQIGDRTCLVLTVEMKTTEIAQ